MKYLVQNLREFVIAICVVICVIVISILAIMSGDPVKMGGALVNDVATLLGLYFNIPTSKENCEHTGAMRLEKKQNNGLIDGENFYDEYEEEECEECDE